MRNKMAQEWLWLIRAVNTTANRIIREKWECKNWINYIAVIFIASRWIVKGTFFRPKTRDMVIPGMCLSTQSGVRSSNPCPILAQCVKQKTSGAWQIHVKLPCQALAIRNSEITSIKWKNPTWIPLAWACLGSPQAQVHSEHPPHPGNRGSTA